MAQPVVAHDLKAPIRQMQTFASFLSEDYGDVLDDDGQKQLRSIDRAAERGFKLIDGMLAYARLSRTSEARTQVDLRSVVDDAIASLAELIEEADAAIKIDDLPTVIGTESQFKQLFQHLINNALKFRHPERRLVIRIEAAAIDASAWKIAVEDNGIGIAIDNHERIFNMLERLHRQDHYEGLGIGLAICKRIAENHDGKIWCQSEEGSGSKFLFTICRDVDCG